MPRDVGSGNSLAAVPPGMFQSKHGSGRHRSGAARHGLVPCRRRCPSCASSDAACSCRERRKFGRFRLHPVPRPFRAGYHQTDGSDRASLAGSGCLSTARSASDICFRGRRRRRDPGAERLERDRGARPVARGHPSHRPCNRTHPRGRGSVAGPSHSSRQTGRGGASGTSGAGGWPVRNRETGWVGHAA